MQFLYRQTQPSEYYAHLSHLFLPRCWMQTRGLAMRILSVCPSVCLSVKRVHCDKTEEKSVYIFIPYEISFSLVFWQEEWLVEVTPSTWNFGSKRPRWSEIANFQSIFARSASAVTRSEKSSINTNRKSTLSNEPKMISYHRTLP